ncbi:MAG: Dabb family protein [Planctomycetota bacterium]
MADETGPGDPRIAHIVFFTLKDPSDENIAALVASCHEYLDGHPGVLFYAAGPRGEAFTRPVNDAEYHVGLHVVFENRAAHDAYQVSDRHVTFVESNKPTWASIRVFDSLV